MSVVLVTTYLSVSYLSAVGLNGGTLTTDVSLSPTAQQVNLATATSPKVTGAVGQTTESEARSLGKWLTSYETARQVAVRHKLPLLLHFEAPWCGACRQMDATVLHSGGVTSMLGSEVIGVRLNADVNKQLIAKFGISTLPSEVVILGDGTRGETFVGATSLTAYVSRLANISGKNSAVFQDGATASDTTRTNLNLRNCLIATRNGEMVGLGGFSPVSLRSDRAWQKGQQMFVATHDGVDYYLTSPAQLAEFESDPEAYIPKFHGCDLVTLRHDHEAKTGAIEFGAFYDGHMYFFASTGNRDRFQKNPAWYLQGSPIAELLTPAMLAEEETLNN